MQGRIGAGIAPLYGTPEISVLVDEGLYGMNCRILEEVSTRDGRDWTKVEMEYGYTGYVPSEMIQKGGWEETLEEGESLLRVWKQMIDVLEEPKVASRILTSIPRGSVLGLANEKEQTKAPVGWIAVRLVDGKIGYTKASFVKPYLPISREVPEDEAAFRQAVTESVRLYEGTAYRWGGKTSEGIDCSGLCSMVYLLHGVIIYRDAAIKEGFPLKEITLEEAKPGDLLFFPGHVAMYLGGDRKLYIHSTAKAGSDGVDYNSLDPEDPLFREDLLHSLNGVGSIFTAGRAHGNPEG